MTTCVAAMTTCVFAMTSCVFSINSCAFAITSYVFALGSCVFASNCITAIDLLDAALSVAIDGYSALINIKRKFSPAIF